MAEGHDERAEAWSWHPDDGPAPPVVVSEGPPVFAEPVELSPRDRHPRSPGENLVLATTLLFALLPGVMLPFAFLLLWGEDRWQGPGSGSVLAGIALGWVLLTLRAFAYAVSGGRVAPARWVPLVPLLASPILGLVLGSAGVLFFVAHVLSVAAIVALYWPVARWCGRGLPGWAAAVAGFVLLGCASLVVFGGISSLPFTF
ncbi:hypothetical protein [Demequina subtropica]|uniref:hypothetical protein n=1 Tax=Demequina subtropica TaxID=1638989 RepID=UPI0007831845|nr:hypothetical protein [Demequina subtropica]